jgi:hypothetical protein
MEELAARVISPSARTSDIPLDYTDDEIRAARTQARATLLIARFTGTTGTTAANAADAADAADALMRFCRIADRELARRRHEADADRSRQSAEAAAAAWARCVARRARLWRVVLTFSRGDAEAFEAAHGVLCDPRNAAALGYEGALPTLAECEDCRGCEADALGAWIRPTQAAPPESITVFVPPRTHVCLIASLHQNAHALNRGYSTPQLCIVEDDALDVDDLRALAARRGRVPCPNSFSRARSRPSASCSFPTGRGMQAPGRALCASEDGAGSASRPLPAST